MALKLRWPALGREALVLIVALWTIQFILVTLRQNLTDAEAPGFEHALRRAAICVAGMGFFYLIGQVLMAVRRGGVLLRVAIALPLAAVGAVAHYIVNSLVFMLTMPGPPDFEGMWDPISIYYNALFWFWGYFAWAITAVALSYSQALRDRDRRLADSEALAHRAQLRALRYQVNPHFLFNALNATAALVTAQENHRAEEMLANLADFLRASLATDPLDDIPLGAELDYVRLYLDIEQVRFAERLRVRIDLPDALRDVLVPSLILQPLFENAIKYGVSPATRPVTIAVSVRRDGDRLLIEVADNGSSPTAAAAGTGVGLANVAQRLSTRFGSEGSLVAAKPPGGGFTATLTLPLRFAPTSVDERVPA